MSLEELIYKNRSYRRFDESVRMEYNTLKRLVGLARLSSSGANRQPLKFMIINSPGDCSKVFPSVLWAAYLKDWDGPGPGERPAGYIIILGDKSVSEIFGVDHGIAAQSIMLGATEAGFGGCMIASIKKELLRNVLNIPEQYEILLILAMGKPVENVIIDDMKDNDVRYWRDSEQNHHVPKRSIDELIVRF